MREWRVRIRRFAGREFLRGKARLRRRIFYATRPRPTFRKLESPWDSCGVSPSCLRLVGSFGQPGLPCPFAIYPPV